MTDTTFSDATISYVILCHRNAPQVLRLARTIRAASRRARVLIRHNQPPGFIDTCAAEEAGAHLLVSDIECRWGNWSLVEASLEACRHARKLHDPDWTILISGQDYPIRPLEPWEATLLEDERDAVLPGDRLVERRFGLLPGGTRERLKMRYTHRWYWLPRLRLVSRLPRGFTRVMRSAWFKLFYPLQAVVVLNALPRDEGWALGIRRHSVPWSSTIPLYKGSQWVALSRRAVKACVDSARARRMQEYFATTLVPDEAYFQTVLANDPDIRVSPGPISWLRWEGDVSPHPVVIREPELQAAVRSGAPFARKFDELVAPGMLDRVDEALLFQTR